MVAQVTFLDPASRRGEHLPPPDVRRRPADWRIRLAIPALLLLIGWGLRLFRLDFQPLWWDEGYSVWFATHSLGEMLALTARDIHPPLYYALLHGWIALFGPAPVSLRIFSVVVSLPTLALVIPAARRLWPTNNRLATLSALGVVAFNPYHLYYSQEIRMYGLVASLALSYLIAVAPWLQPRPGQQARPLALLLATTALAYTQYYALLLPLSVVILVLARARRGQATGRPALRSLLTAHVGAALLYLPWLAYALPKLSSYVAYKVTQDADLPLAPLDYLARHLSAFLIGHAAPDGLNSLAIAALILLAVLAILPLLVAPTRVTAKRSFETSCWWLLGSVLTAGFLLNQRFPFAPLRGERLLMAIAPLFWLWLAARLQLLLLPGLTVAAKRVGPAAVWRSSSHSRPIPTGQTISIVTFTLAASLLLVTGLSVWQLFVVNRYAKEDYRPVMQTMAHIGGPQDAALCVYPWQVGYLRSYLPGGPQPILASSSNSANDTLRWLHEILVGGRRIWFPAHLSLGGILENEIEASLIQQGFPVLNRWISPSTRLTLFEPAPTVWQAAPGGRFGDWLTLAGAEVGQTPVASGQDALPVRLTWRVTQPPTGEWQVRLRLMDANKQGWAQRDSAPANGLRPFDQWAPGESGEDRHALWIPAGTPPGRYALRIQVYQAASDDGQSPRPLDVTDEQGQRRGSEWTLAEVEVTRPAAPLAPLRLALTHPRQQQVGEALRWLGFDLADRPWQPGDDLTVSLGWQVQQTPMRTWRAFVQILDGDGRVAAGWEGPPLPNLPTIEWRAGDLLRTPFALRLPASLPDGRYRLIAGLFDPATGQRLAPHGQRADFLTLAQATVQGRPHRFAEAPAPQTSQAAQFGGQARLLGFDLTPAQVRPGAAVTLTLHWQSGEPWERRAAVFVHLLDAAGQTVAQADGEPGAGLLPTTGWLAGEFLSDTHVLSIPPDLPQGSYRIEIGFYFEDGARLPLADGSPDHALVLQTKIMVN